MGTLLIPLAGFGKRFVREGYTQTKPLIHAGDKTIIQLALDSVEITNKTNIVFVVREDQCIINGLDAYLKKLQPKCKIIKLNKATEGSLETAYLALKEMDIDGELYIHTSDICLPKPFKLEDRFDNNHSSAYTVTFKANNPSYSYCKLKDCSNEIIDFMIEKEVVSQLANVGIYGFKSAQDFIKIAESIINNRILVKNEYYISSVFSILFDQNEEVRSYFIEEAHIIGTPLELEFFINHVLKTMKPKTIGFVSDHSGFNFKEDLIDLFKKNKFTTIDFGCYSLSDCDYSDYVPIACKGIQDEEVEIVLGSCNSGQGVNISANKCKDIVSCLPLNEELLTKSRMHNCPNFISFASCLWTPEQAYKAFIKSHSKTNFQGGRHSLRLQKVLK